LLATYLYAHPRDFVANEVEVHSALKSSSDVTKLSDHGGVAEIAGSRIA
jgi:hypothetical protein